MKEGRPHLDLCLNCGANASSRFCPECGQETVSTLVSFRTLLGEFVDDLFSLDSTFLRSLGLLLARPGRLSLEYSRGRRKRYTSPLRIYLFASVTFFLVASFLVGRPGPNGDEARGTGVDSPANADADSNADIADWIRWIPLPDSISRNVDHEIASFDAQRYEVGAGDILLVGESDSLRLPTWMAKRLALPSLPESVRAALAEIEPGRPAGGLGNGEETMRVNMFGQSHEVDERAFLREVFAITPKTLLVLFPVFALLLQLIYRRRERYYVEHLVFSIHCHAFLFLMFTLVAISRKGELVLAALPIIAIYSYLAMKKFYSQGWLKTGVKFALLSGGYLVLLLLTAAVTVAASVWMITTFGG